MASFTEKVYKVVRAIPAGETLTYQQVAKLAGNIKASRAVGNILSKNYNANIPCHRVIKANGELGNYNRGLEQKVSLLKQEGFLK